MANNFNFSKKINKRKSYVRSVVFALTLNSLFVAGLSYYNIDIGLSSQRPSGSKLSVKAGVVAPAKKKAIQKKQEPVQPKETIEKNIEVEKKVEEVITQKKAAQQTAPQPKEIQKVEEKKQVDIQKEKEKKERETLNQLFEATPEEASASEGQKTDLETGDEMLAGLNGEGIDHDVRGWEIKYSPPFDDSTYETGILTARIRVNEYGDVRFIEYQNTSGLSRDVQMIYRQKIEQITFKSTGTSGFSGTAVEGTIRIVLKR